jgi:uncharacterized protein
MQKKIFFTNGTNVKLCGILSNPSGNKSNPIIILAHGFTTSKNSTGIKLLAEKLDNKGISSFRFDFFGHGESEGKFENITVSEGVEDILSAITYVKKQGYKKIGLVGSSFGGICSTLAASKSPELFVLALKSPVSDYPAIDEIKKMQKKGIAEWKKHNYIIYNKEKNLKLNYSFYEDISKLDVYKNAANINIPTIIIHGDKDEEVSVKQSYELVKIIKTSKLLVIKGADHRYTANNDLDLIIDLISQFIEANTANKNFRKN